MKKTLALILCFLMLAGTFAGCAQNSETAADSTVSDTSEDTQAADPRLAVQDNLPEMDYNGYEFNILVRPGNLAMDGGADEVNGDVLNDVLYNRNASVGERYNVKINSIVRTDDDISKAEKDVETSFLSGDNAYDVIMLHSLSMGRLAARGLLYDLMEMPYTDLSAPWWDKSFTDGIKMMDRVYTTAGDACISTFTMTWLMVFNKNLFEQYSIEEPYQMVLDGTWTFEEFAKIAAIGKTDLNGDGKYQPADDRFGTIFHEWGGLINWLYAGDSRIISKDKDDMPQIVLNSDRTLAIVDYLYNMIFEKGDSVITSNDSPTLFKQGQVMIMPSVIDWFNFYRDMESDFGVVPFPKYDASMKNYATISDGHGSLIGVPYNAPDIERTSIILEALNVYGYKYVMPVYYEVVLSGKFMRDEQSIQMLDIVRNNRTCDIGYIYSNGTMEFVLRDLMLNKSKNFASYYSKLERRRQKDLDKLVENFMTF